MKATDCQLIRESRALRWIHLEANRASREWLRARLPHHIAMLPELTRLYTVGEVRALRDELATPATLRP
jgi:hypothetical protein